MAKRIGKLLYSGRGRSSGGFSASWQNLDLVNDMLSRIADDIRDADSRRIVRSASNSRLRQKTKVVAERLLVPALEASARRSPTKIAKHMSIKAKADRFVTVQIGGANPKGLRGFKAYIGTSRAQKKSITWRNANTGRAKSSRTYRTTLAWGSEFGPHPKSKVNHYAVSRNEGGYWVQPGANAAMPQIREAYKVAIEEVVNEMRRGR